MKQRRDSFLILTACICIAVLSLPFAAAAEALPAENALCEPSVEPDATLSTGFVTEWCCVTFGTYPQTEVVPAPSEAVDVYAVQEGDFLVDPELFNQLTGASWTDNETEIDGIRYLRMNRQDAANSASDSMGHYRWGSEDEYHYFRYDPIRWRIIALEDHQALLMADKLMDCQPYHTEEGPVTWKSSTVRSWLNGLPGSENAAGIDYRGRGFLDKAFSDSERKAVLITKVVNSPNSAYHTDCGEDTEDPVFLLSNKEVFESDDAARHGFYAASGKDDPAKRFRSTMYAKCRGAWWSSVSGYMGNSFWFMRTNGYTPESITYICDFGYIYQRGTMAVCNDAGILPAIWISLDDANVETAGWVSSGDIERNAYLDISGRKEKSRLANPVVVADPDMPDGKRVTYSAVQFGSYPQTEIVGDAAEAAGRSIVDAERYAALEKAEWEADEWESGGCQYLRVKTPGDNTQIQRYRYFIREPILWRVLEIRDGTALLLADAALECEPFQREQKGVSWEDCTLRSWLNGYDAKMNISAVDFTDEKNNFLDMAFRLDEQDAIIENLVRNESNYYFDVDSGRDTQDKIFILAESELFIYDSSIIHGFNPWDAVMDRAKQFQPTDYALMKGAWHASGGQGDGNVFWITRTTGYTHSNVVYVDESGCMYNRGILVNCSDAAIIPALVLDLNSSAYKYAGTITIDSER